MSVTVETCLTCSAGLEAVTAAPGNAPPESSVTTPSMLPELKFCALAGWIRAPERSNARNAAGRIFAPLHPCRALAAIPRTPLQAVTLLGQTHLRSVKAPRA